MKAPPGAEVGRYVGLDRQRAMDFFGTEGQCDPRGDHRR